MCRIIRSDHFLIALKSVPAPGCHMPPRLFIIYLAAFLHPHEISSLSIICNKDKDLMTTCGDTYTMR